MMRITGLMLLLFTSGVCAQPEPTVTPEALRIRGVEAEQLKKWSKNDQAAWETIVRVRLSTADPDQLVAGKYSIDQGEIVFEPRFPWVPGLKYRAAFQISADVRHSWTFSVPAIKRKPTTVVSAVYPSGDTLLENHLRFYLHFSKPMRSGEVYQYIHLLDAKGREVKMPWLELDEELWDATGQRLTLLIHPGRIKQGLQPREEHGPVLQPGQSYTLVIDDAWRDEDDLPLANGFRKTYRVLPGTDHVIDAKGWKITPPLKDAPLIVKFERGLDHAMIQRLLRIENAAGEPVLGKGTLNVGETEWRFTAAQPWQPGAYRMMVPTHLEDPAGNRVDRPFEVDVVRPMTGEVRAAQLALPFVVR